MLYRKIVCITASILVIFSAVTVNAESELKVSAMSAVLYCADSGQVIYEKNSHEKRAIASITKIMTAIIALESDCDKKVKFTYDMIAEGSSMYLQVGDVLEISELVKGMMMVSGNDAANAIAIAIGGSKEKFADMMNAKANEIGMKDTHFVTPSGLDDEEHYSTAYDMALLCSYAMQNDDFKNIVSHKSMEVEFESPENKVQTYVNHNKLLSLYDKCIGIKTGFTKKAGRTLTSCAESDGVRLIAVTLNDGNDWNDHISMYEYGFAMTEKEKFSENIEISVVGSKKQSIKVVSENEAELSVLKDTKDKIEKKIYMPHFLYAPIEKGENIGEVIYFLDGRELYRSRLVTAESCLYKE